MKRPGIRPRQASPGRDAAASRTLPVLFLLLLLAAASPAWTQANPLEGLLPGRANTETPATDQGTDPAGALEAQRNEISSLAQEAELRLNEALALENQTDTLTPGVSPEMAQSRIQAARSLFNNYQFHLQQFRELQGALEQGAAARALLGETVSIEEKPPYSFEFLDKLRGQVEAKQRELEAEQIGLEALRQLGVREERSLEQIKTAFNQASEAHRRAVTEEEKNQTLFNLDTVRRNQRSAEARIAALKTGREASSAKIRRLMDELDLARRRAALAAGLAIFQKEEMERLDAASNKVRAAVEEEISRARRELDRRYGQANDAARRLERALGKQDEPAMAALQRAEQARAEATQNLLAVLESLLEIESDALGVWRLRFSVANPEAAGQRTGLRAAETLLNEKNQHYESLRTVFEQRLSSLRAQKGGLDRDIEGLVADDPLRDPLTRRRAALDEREATVSRMLDRIGRVKTLLRYALEDVRTRRSAQSPAERAAAVWTWLRENAGGVLDRELTTIGEESISPRKLLYALVILIAGVVLSRVFLRYLRHHAAKRLKLGTNVVYVTESLTRYALYFFVFYAALRYLNISLTAFAFLGGAVAIGIGFGAQNLISNFLSGLIIMGEQPIRLNDIVEVGGLTGRVTRMGARASVLRTFSGIEVLVPNSKFLENNVVNWTLTDQKMRFDVTVGVAYGSPTRMVKEIMQQAAEKHGLVLRDPDPVVTFQDFGDNALIFALYFWLDLGNADSRVVRSDLRFMIEKKFHEAGISIAYPQRDLHLDSLKPLEVRLLRDDPAPEEHDKEKDA